MKNTKAALAAIGILAAAVAAPAAAQEAGWYVGGSIGYSQYKNICNRTNQPCDSTDAAWRGFGGRQFNRHFAAELGYGNLGEARADGVFTAETRSFDVSGVATIPLTGRLGALVRLGVYRARSDVDADPASTAVGGGHTNSGFTYGAGLGTNFGILGLRFDWQRYENVGGGAIGEDDIDVFSLGALIRF